MSQTVKDLVAGSGLAFEDRGELELTGDPIVGASTRSPVEILGSVAKKRVQFRPPGLKPTTKVGTLGPYRGRLGLAWVIAPLVAGIGILLAGLLILTR